MKSKITSKITFCAILASLSTIAFLIESLFPPLILPGAKMGISNVFILIALLLIGYPYAFAVLLVKVVLGSLFAGNVSAIVYSLPAGALALSIEIITLKFIPQTSIIATSILGSVVNITAQNVIFCIVSDTLEYLYYSPYLALIGVLSGIIVGYTVYLVIKKIIKIQIHKEEKL